MAYSGCCDKTIEDEYGDIEPCKVWIRNTLFKHTPIIIQPKRIVPTKCFLCKISNKKIKTLILKKVSLNEFLRSRLLDYAKLKRGIIIVYDFENPDNNILYRREFSYFCKDCLDYYFTIIKLDILKEMTF